MGNFLTPGPPLRAGDEFCECDPPTGGEYVKATAAALLAMAIGGGAEFGIALATGRLWGIVGLVAGCLTGCVVHRAAGRHRSVATGYVAAGAALLGAGASYGLLWLPFISRTVLMQTVLWSYVPLTVFGWLLAYWMAGPRGSRRL